MSAGRLCQLVHDGDREHVVRVPVGVVTTWGPVLYADRDCAYEQDLDDDQLTDPSNADKSRVWS